MSKTRLGKEQAAKASDSAEDRSAPPTDISEIMKAIASSEKTILERIDSSTKDLNDKIDTIKEDLEKHETRLDSVEFGLNTYSDRTVELESEVSKLKSEVAKSTDKVDDIEGRQRRCNARIVGVKEGFENTGKTTDVVATMLKEMLGLNFTPTLDRAHRSLGQPGNSPRAIVVKFHYFQEKEDVFRRAASSQPLFLQDMKISIFHDFTAIVAKKRAAFSEAKRLLRDVTGVKFGVLFPSCPSHHFPNGTRQAIHGSIGSYGLH
ncbi:hypothetical protein WMY93_030606 [Mugilogobius chulae]|uniref:L1 transposable element RRM domain-containing protein n=1 Tax=Mugilogobius chulae TaxID=88201 RepID=A0AAW0MNX5_9GOBI